jgi:uncharacterized repeat protein (TIGR04138 family)
MLEPHHPLAELLRRDRRYHFDAYVFVFEALRYAQEVMRLGSAQPSELDEETDERAARPERHVTGQELCEAIRRFALEQYGLMAESVLHHWGITSTGDFGEIVYNLIDVGEMSRRETDRREDFDDVFDFSEGFREGFEIRLPDSTEGKRG